MKKIIFCLPCLLLTTAAFAQSNCQTAMSSAAAAVIASPSQKAVVWRQAATNQIVGVEVKSNASRESEIRKAQRSMVKDITKEDTTPGMEVFPASDADADYSTNVSPFGGGGGSTINHIIYKNVDQTGARLTMALPVSGHVGLDNAKKWSTTDTYKIWMQKPDGSRTVLVESKSLDFVTFQDIVVPIKKGESVRLLYDRSGSAGPAGFPDGRTIDISAE